MSGHPGPGPRTIPRVPAIVRLGRVPVPHTNEATYAVGAVGEVASVLVARCRAAVDLTERYLALVEARR